MYMYSVRRWPWRINRGEFERSTYTVAINGSFRRRAIEGAFNKVQDRDSTFT